MKAGPYPKQRPSPWFVIDQVVLLVNRRAFRFAPESLLVPWNKKYLGTCNIGQYRYVIPCLKKGFFFLDTDMLDLRGLASLSTSFFRAIHDAWNRIPNRPQKFRSLLQATAGLHYMDSKRFEHQVEY
jgi:hypothetical protein